MLLLNLLNIRYKKIFYCGNRKHGCHWDQNLQLISDNSNKSSGDDMKNTPSPSHQTNVSPSTKTVTFKKRDDPMSPNRPSTLPMPGAQTGTSEPIPVPTQANAYKRIKSGGSFNSPPKDMDISPSSSVKVFIILGYCLSSNDIK